MHDTGNRHSEFWNSWSELMRVWEFLIKREKLHFFSKPGVHAILEAYANPEDELEISFREVAAEHGRHYYYATIKEKATDDTRVAIQFTLDENKKALDIGNIEPFLRPDEQGKMVHTSMSSDETGLDLGHRGVVWALSKIKQFARSEGFEVRQVSSATRYTGARAKDNQGSDESGLPKHFNVKKSIRESVVLRDTGLWYVTEDDQ
jgi:hypothetical protein